MGGEETIWAAVGVFASLGQEIWHPGGVVYGLEECVCTRSERERAIAGSGAGDAIWADVPAAGDSHHRRQFATSERSGGEETMAPTRIAL